jgi:tRNA A-37 threonylcarbamoyl transferase component Bud32
MPVAAAQIESGGGSEDTLDSVEVDWDDDSSGVTTVGPPPLPPDGTPAAVTSGRGESAQPSPLPVTGASPLPPPVAAPPSWDDVTMMAPSSSPAATPGAASVGPPAAGPPERSRSPVPRPSGAMPMISTAAPPAVAAAPVPAVDEEQVGTIFADRYRILGKLGEGGMGVVYLAEHVIIEKRVALKVLSRDFARKADLVQRFMQEAKAASRIGHENIVDITDFGETPSGSVFFAMEYLDGHDLAHHIRTGGPMFFDRARHIATQICRALGAAHAKGIIHRDMKPENVFLIEREGRTDFVKILDFGIAKMSSLDSEAGGSRLTRTGMIFGTPEYMSPEQARGDRPDHRVDVYAVGCILYEMLTGDVPFHADTFMGVLTRHMFDAPEPMTQRSPSIALPSGAEEVVMRALAKDREQRFQTMKEFSLALAACGGGMNVAEAWGDEPSHVERSATGLRPMITGLSPMISARMEQLALPTAPAQEAGQKRSRMIWYLAGAMIAAGAIGGAGYHLVTRRPLTVQAPVVPPSVEISSASTNDVPLPAAHVKDMAKLEVRTTPPGAEVFIGSVSRGLTPLVLELPRADPVAITLRKASFRDHEETLTPKSDRTYEFQLEELRSASTGRPTGRDRSSHRSDGGRSGSSSRSGSTKSKTKLDLKDPFAQ